MIQTRRAFQRYPPRYANLLLDRRNTELDDYLANRSLELFVAESLSSPLTRPSKAQPEMSAEKNKTKTSA